MKPLTRNATKIQCRDCKKIIFSSYSGEFVKCDCGGDDYIYIDETEHYCRIGGDKDKYVRLED